MYRICITGGRSFSATTVGGSDVDTQLSLFNRMGRGVYANDDDADGVQSRLPAGHRLTPKAGGKYYLAISSYDNDPVSAGGLIFPSHPFDGLFGPSGRGGAGSITGWTGHGFEPGDYTILVTGVRACGGPVGG